MNKLFININNLNIAYYDNFFDGPSIIFIHGNSHSGKTFWKQFEAPLFSKFRLISIDLPGHGDSESDFDDEAYSLPYYSEILQNFIAKLDLNNSLFVGHSLGGHILLEAASRLNARGFLIFGTPPVGNPLSPAAFLPHKDSGLLFKGELTDCETMLFAEACFSHDRSMIQETVECIKKTHSQARVKLAASLGESKYKDEIEVVKNLQFPLAILSGKDEKLVNNEWFNEITIPTLWRDKVMIIEGGHNIHLENHHDFNFFLSQFAEEIFKLESTTSKKCLGDQVELNA